MRSKRAVPTVVIDTNVLYAADDLNDSLCQKASLEQIESVKMGKERIALDKQEKAPHCATFHTVDVSNR